MNLTTARNLVRRHLKSGGDSNRYSAAQLDDAIYVVGSELAREARCTRATSSVSLVANTSTIDFSTLTGFRPDLLIEDGIYIVFNPATATAVLTAQALTSITVVSGGSGYTSAPTVSFSGGGGSGAAATAVLTSDVVTSFTGITAGSGYTSVPTVVLSGGNGYSAAKVQYGIEVVPYSDIISAQARRGTSLSTPRAIAFRNTTGNTASQDGIVYPPPDSLGAMKVNWTPPFTVWEFGVAQVTAVLSGTGLANITVNQGGGFYDATPTVTFTGGGGSSAAATAVLTDGIVTSFTSITAGTGYTSAPTVLLNGASAAAVTFNIPDDLLIPALAFGGSLVPQLNEIEAVNLAFRSQAWVAHVQMCRSRNDFGTRVVTRSMGDDIPEWR